MVGRWMRLIDRKTSLDVRKKDSVSRPVKGYCTFVSFFGLALGGSTWFQMMGRGLTRMEFWKQKKQ